MKDTYCLNGKELPVIPTPHDCMIKEIRMEKQELIFVFEDDILGHESAQFLKTEAKSLIMRIHLLHSIYDITLLQRKNHIWDRIFHRPGVYKEIDIVKYPRKLIGLSSGCLEYIHHNVGNLSMIIELFSPDEIILNLTADYVEIEWIE